LPDYCRTLTRGCGLPVGRKHDPTLPSLSRLNCTAFAVVAVRAFYGLYRGQRLWTFPLHCTQPGRGSSIWLTVRWLAQALHTRTGYLLLTLPSHPHEPSPAFHIAAAYLLPHAQQRCVPAVPFHTVPPCVDRQRRLTALIFWLVTCGTTPYWRSPAGTFWLFAGFTALLLRTNAHASVLPFLDYAHLYVRCRIPLPLPSVVPRLFAHPFSITILRLFATLTTHARFW